MTIVIFFAFVFSVADFFQCVNFILNNTFSELSFELFPKLHYTVNQSICLLGFFFASHASDQAYYQISVCPTTAYLSHATHFTFCYRLNSFVVAKIILFITACQYQNSKNLKPSIFIMTEPPIWDSGLEFLLLYAACKIIYRDQFGNGSVMVWRNHVGGSHTPESRINTSWRRLWFHVF